MTRVTKEQITAAKQMSAIEFLRRYRAADLVPSAARGEYQLKSHDSFKINGTSSIWHWKSRDIGGKSALDYLVYVEGCSFVEAVRLLCEESPGFVPQNHSQVEQVRPTFVLPPAAPNNRCVVAYLLERGIHREVIADCIRRGDLYESARYHNCVFVGRDEHGQPQYAALRGTYTQGKPFKQEVAGSQKRYGFTLPPSSQSKRVAVFESAIDAMAELSLHGDDKHRLSLGGIYAPTDNAHHKGKPPAALEEFLRRHPEITEIELCLDNDARGRAASAAIARHYQPRFAILDSPPPIAGGDYADLAKQLRQQTARSRAACR